MHSIRYLKMQSLTLPEAYFNWSIVYSSYSKQCSYFAKKKQGWWSHTEKHVIYGPGLRFISVLHENGAVSDRYESKGVFTWHRGDVRAGPSSLWFPLMVLYLFTGYHHKMPCRHESPRREFTPVVVPGREFHSVTKFRQGILSTRNDHSFRCEIGLPVDWNRLRMRNVCNLESHLYFMNMKSTFK